MRIKLIIVHQFSSNCVSGQIYARWENAEKKISQTCINTDAEIKINLYQTTHTHAALLLSLAPKILGVNVRSPGLDHKSNDECISWSGLGSVPPSGSVPLCSTTALGLVLSVWNGNEPSYFWALLCICRQTYGPLLWFIRMLTLFHIKTARYLKWEESAFIYWRGEEVWALKLHEWAREEQSVFLLRLLQFKQGQVLIKHTRNTVGIRDRTDRTCSNITTHAFIHAALHARTSEKQKISTTT